MLVDAVDVMVNGESRRIAAGTSVAAFLVGLSLDGRKVAVERNAELVMRSRYAETVLGAGDRLEIVHFIGGG